jgi:hypothetical protein
MDSLQSQLDTPAQLAFERSFYIGSYVTAILYGQYLFHRPHFCLMSDFFSRDAALHVLFIELLPPLFFDRCSQGVLFLHILWHCDVNLVDRGLELQCGLWATYLVKKKHRLSKTRESNPLELGSTTGTSWEAQLNTFLIIFRPGTTRSERLLEFA